MSIEIFILIILLGLSGFFSGAETALVSVSLAKVKTLVKQKKLGSVKLLKLKQKPKTLITTILIGNNLANIAAAALTTKLMIDLFGSNGVAIATGILTLVILVFGEITPKNIAHTYSVKVSLLIAGPIYFLTKLLFPLIFVLNLFTTFIIRASGGKHIPIVTEEELKTMIDMGVEEGEVEKKEREMIENVFELNDITAEEVMTPRIAMFCLDENLSLKDAMQTLAKTPYSRIPIIRSNRDNVIGILYVKDVLKALQKGQKNVKLKTIAREPYFIPEDILLNQLFKKFQDKKIHMAVVVDEHGGVAGLITLEDLLEEIVGEIVDETDITPHVILRVDKNNILVDADTELKNINEFFNIKLPGNINETVSKLVLKKLKKIPKKGDKVKIDKNVMITVEEATKNKIHKLKVTNLNGRSKI
ncbi:MAG: hemolysin family protein [Nanoarchaeota archaeon]|nr:hemolysin family protein [Nanoarchaeota archaeon]MCG2718777.1 hemolysin family protein [Nanoarchaeota archaeon]